MCVARNVKAAALAVLAAGTIVLVGMEFVSTRVHAQDDADSEEAQIAIGWRIAPSFILARGKNPALVGLGSLIVNAQADCNGCHGPDPTNEYLSTDNRYFLAPNSPAKFNQATHLNGGQNVGPAGVGIVQDVNSPPYAGPRLGPNIITRNLTPDHTGNPEAGNDLDTFVKIMRTGHDFDQLRRNLRGERHRQLPSVASKRSAAPGHALAEVSKHDRSTSDRSLGVPQHSPLQRPQ